MRDALSLDGTWKFCPAFIELEANQRFMNPGFNPQAPESEAAATGPWIEPGFDDSGWLDVPVPASWNKAVEDLWSYEGHGWYRQEFLIPRAWEGRRVEFHSDGANYRTVVHVNGQVAGVHEGGYNPFSIPIHEYLRFGENNTLAISVDNLPKRERCPGGQFDWWNHGGLYRSVRLEVMNPVRLDDVYVVTEYAQPVSRVGVHVQLVSDHGESPALRVRATLRDAGGLLAAQSDTLLRLAEGKAQGVLDLSVADATPWSPDTPDLYTLAVDLLDGDTGDCLDACSRKVGIRTIQVQGPRLLLNGEPFIIKGFSRYEDYPDSGRTPNAVACRRDLQLVKEMGGNTIRSHCPHSPETYDLCDEMGMFFVSELPFYQWGRPLVETDSPEALDAAKSQLREMIRWQRSHPCVLMWSVSNETMCKPRLDTDRERELAEMVVKGNIDLVEICHEMDPTRPAIEISNCWPGDRVFEKTDLSAVNMYIGATTPHVSTLNDLAVTMHKRLDALRLEQPDKPILISEFGSWCIRGLDTDHYPGERYQAALLKTYWEALEREDHVIGGLVWCFADSDVHRRFQWVYEYRCAYGVVDYHRNLKRAAETLRMLWKKQ